MVNKSLCPFCKREVTKHSAQCQYGNIPTAEQVKSQQDRKKESDIKKLNRTKSALNNNE